MHHHKIPPLINIALEIRDLVFRRGAQGPQPILHVDTPFNELRAGDKGCESLADACPFGAERGTKVGRCYAERGRDGGDVVAELPVDGGKGGEAFHGGMGEGMVGDLVPGCEHAFVDGGEVRAGVEECSADCEERYVDAGRGDGRDDPLGVLWIAIIDGEGEGVGACAGEE